MDAGLKGYLKERRLKRFTSTTQRLKNGAGCDVDVGFHSSVSRRGETTSYKKSIDFCRAGEYRPPVLARGCFLRACASLRTRSIQPKNRETDSRVSSYKVEAR